ncbi:MAG: N-acetylglucosamine kinase [Rhodothermales bacterium]
MSMYKTLLIGLDAGGTKTRIASRFTDQAHPVYFEGKGINIKRDGLDNAVTRCIQLVKAACKDTIAGNSITLCAGIAGAGREHDKQYVQKKLTAGFPQARSVHCTALTDADIAYYAAHGDASGILMIAGTGSIILAKTKANKFVRAGGWGRLLGDEGGGYKIGQDGLAAVARAFDGGPSTMLSALLREAFQLDTGDALIEFTYDKDAALQNVAPLVLKAAELDDQVALQIINNQLEALSNQLGLLLNRYPDTVKNVVLTGGLSGNTFYVNLLTSKIADHYPGGIQSSVLQTQAEDAALQLAAARFNSQQSNT